MLKSPPVSELEGRATISVDREASSLDRLVPVAISEDEGADTEVAEALTGKETVKNKRCLDSPVKAKRSHQVTLVVSNSQFSDYGWETREVWASSTLCQAQTRGGKIPGALQLGCTVYPCS